MINNQGMKGSDEIAQELIRIVGKRIQLFSGVVKSVDSDAMTCSVELTAAQGTEVQVVLNVVLENKAGMYCVPAVDAGCVVCLVDGGSVWELLKATGYDRVYMKAGSKFIDITDSAVLLNGDGFGGLVKVQETADKIKALEQDLNTLKQVFTAWTPVSNDGGAALKTAATTWAGQLIMPLTSKNDLENTKVKHG